MGPSPTLHICKKNEEWYTWNEFTTIVAFRFNNSFLVKIEIDIDITPHLILKIDISALAKPIAIRGSALDNPAKCSPIGKAQVQHIGSNKRIQKLFSTHMQATKFLTNFHLRITMNESTIWTRKEIPSWLHVALLKSSDLKWGKVKE